MKSRKIIYTKIILPVLFLSACIYNGRPDRLASPERVNGYDCYINATDNNDSVDILFNYFRTESEKYIAVPAGVSLDAINMHVDSSLNMGVYYEAEYPLNEFKGPHVLRLINLENERIRDSFSFARLVLDTVLTEVSKKDSLVLSLGGMEKGDELNVDITDTSFDGTGVSLTDTVRSEKFVIHSKDWRELSNGPLVMTLMRVHRYQFGNRRIHIIYTIRREFKLKA